MFLLKATGLENSNEPMTTNEFKEVKDPTENGLKILIKKRAPAKNENKLKNMIFKIDQ